MIRVTVELLPHGREQGKRTLGTLEIANNLSGNLLKGNYSGVLHAEYTRPEGRQGRVQEFNRKTQSVWSLVGAFLKLFGHTRHSHKLMDCEPFEQLASVAVQTEPEWVRGLLKFLQEETEVASYLEDFEEEQGEDDSYDSGFYGGRAEQCYRIAAKIRELVGESGEKESDA